MNKIGVESIVRMRDGYFRNLRDFEKRIFAGDLEVIGKVVLSEADQEFIRKWFPGQEYLIVKSIDGFTKTFLSGNLELASTSLEVGEPHPGHWASPRPIGLGYGPGCFVAEQCGEKSLDMHPAHDCAMFVGSQDEGDEIVSWFGGFGAWLDYRQSEPNRIQIKVTCCDKHLPNLEHLVNSVCVEKLITPRKILAAKNLEPKTLDTQKSRW